MIDSDDRLLPDGQEIGATNSVTECRRVCAEKGFPYMGVQATTWCFCGDTPPPSSSQVSTSECNHICPGDSEQKCGGGFRMNVYEIKEGLEISRILISNQVMLN